MQSHWVGLPAFYRNLLLSLAQKTNAYMKNPVDEISIVLFPTPEQLNLIKTYKQLLKNRIPKGYGSANSAAHISILQFKTHLEFILYANQIREFCKTLTPQDVTFDSWGKFEYAGAFYLAQDASSKIYLDCLIFNINIYLRFPIDKKQVNAHMSIGRKLFGEKMKIAEETFKEIKPNFTFNCDALCVRKFDGRQYSKIIEKIDFGK